jgi:hypothetical protein
LLGGKYQAVLVRDVQANPTGMTVDNLWFTDIRNTSYLVNSVGEFIARKLLNGLGTCEGESQPWRADWVFRPVAFGNGRNRELPKAAASD